MIQVPAKHILPVPRPDPEVVAMLTSGLTASIALEKVVLNACAKSPSLAIYARNFLT